MTGQLTDLMHERADRLERRDLDLEQIVREGDKRVQRRRTALVGGVAALAVAAAVAIPALVGGGGPGDDTTVIDPDLAAAFVAHTPSYALGSEVTVDGTTFDVGRTVRAYVQTDVGIVFSDAEGTVWAANGADVTEVGTVNAKVPRLVADGTRVGGVEDDDPRVRGVRPGDGRDRPRPAAERRGDERRARRQGLRGDVRPRRRPRLREDPAGRCSVEHLHGRPHRSSTPRPTASRSPTRRTA